MRNNFTVADKAARQADVENIKMWVEIASQLGAPVLRVFADTQMRDMHWQDVSPGKTHAQVAAAIADNLKECAEHGEKHGVVIGVQNHVAVVDLYVAIGDENVGFPALLIGLELHHAVAGDHAHLRRLRARGRGAENQQTHGRRVPEKMRRAAHGMYAAQSSWLA